MKALLYTDFSTISTLVEDECLISEKYWCRNFFTVFGQMFQAFRHVEQTKRGKVPNLIVNSELSRGTLYLVVATLRFGPTRQN